MNHNRHHLRRSILVIILICVSAGLGLYRLGTIPSGFYVDEATIGYNAYSLLTTGRDEYGQSFPVALRLFGSYSPPLYAYLTAVSIQLMGTNIFAVRVTSVIFSIMMTLTVYSFLKISRLGKSPYTPLVGALLFTISPWNVLYSRVGYELYLAFGLFMFGALILWRGITQARWIPIGMAILSISVYAAHPQRYLVPIFIIGWLLTFRKQLTIHKVPIYIGMIIALIIQIPNLTIVTTPAFWNKSNLFYSVRVTDQATALSVYLPNVIALPIAFIREFLSIFLSYFSPKSLFFIPDPDPQRSMPELSVFYAWMIIPYVIGLYYLWKTKTNLTSKFIILLAITCPLPAAFTSDPFSTQRALPLLFPLIIIISLGIDKLIVNRHLAIIIPLGLIVFSGSLVLLWRSYFIFLPQERAQAWSYGYRQLAEYITDHPDQHFLIDPTRLKPAYVELLWFMRYPPSQYQQTVDSTIKHHYYDNPPFDPQVQFANVEIKPIEWKYDIYEPQIIVGDELVISEQQALDHFLEPVFTITDPLDQVIFKGYQTNPDLKNAHNQSLNQPDI